LAQAVFAQGCQLLGIYRPTRVSPRCILRDKVVVTSKVGDMAMLKSLVFALVVIGAAGNSHGEAAATPGVLAEPKSKTELEAEVLKLTEELEEAKEKGSETGEAAGLVLLGSVAFVMIIFYMVNSKEAKVRRQTWNLTSTSISIFAAVMLNTGVKELGIAVGVKGEVATVMTEFAYLICWWLAAVALLYIARNSALRLLGYGTIYGHILGFAAIGAYGTLAVEYFNGQHWNTLFVIFLYIVTIPLLIAPTAMLGKMLKHEALHEQCKETSLDFFAMGLSYLICMFFRGWIKFHRTGTAAGQHAVPTGSRPHEVALLILVGTVFILMAMLFHYMQKAKAKMAEIFHVLATVCALTCAWCWLDAANWVFLSKLAPNAGHHERRLNEHEIAEPEGAEGEGLGLFHMPQGVFMAQIMVAAFNTLVFVIAIYLFVCLARVVGHDVSRFLKGSLTAVSLLVGLSWEHLFDTAIEQVAEMAEMKKGQQLIKVLISFLLVLVVLPAWMVFILPKHNDELIEKYQGKQLSVFACCGDCADSDEDGDYDEADDEEDIE